MTNFDSLKTTPDFDAFLDIAISKKKILHIDGGVCQLCSWKSQKHKK